MDRLSAKHDFLHGVVEWRNLFSTESKMRYGQYRGVFTNDHDLELICRNVLSTVASDALDDPLYEHGEEVKRWTAD